MLGTEHKKGVVYWGCLFDAPYTHKQNMKQNIKRKKRFSSLFLILVMIVSVMFGLTNSALAAETPVFETDLSTAEVTFSVGDTADALTVTASVYDGGTITYQWYSSEDNTNFTPIAGAEANSYTSPTETAGTSYYYVTATNILAESSAAATSSTAVVTVEEVTAAETPVFKTDLSTAEVTFSVGDTADALTVIASVYDGGTITYQWYSSEDNTNFTPIAGTEANSYTPPTETAGTSYYYVTATNTLVESSAAATSSTAVVTVEEVTAAETKWSIKNESGDVLPITDLGIYQGLDYFLVETSAEATSINISGVMGDQFMDLLQANILVVADLVINLETGPTGENYLNADGSSWDLPLSEFSLGTGDLPDIEGIVWDDTPAYAGIRASDAALVTTNCFIIQLTESSGEDSVFTITDMENTYGTAIGEYNGLPLYKVSVASSYESLIINSSNYGSTPINRIFADQKDALAVEILPTASNAIFSAAMSSFNASPELSSYKTDDDANYLLFYSLYRFKKTTEPVCYLIVEWGEQGSAEKTSLQAVINSVTGENAQSYYQAEDRWNGTETSENGFWNDMQTVLIEANTINDNTAASQSAVDAAEDQLQNAISKLLPTANVNATLLYEAVQLAGTKVIGEYSAVAWTAMQDELTAANDMLDSLYNEGSPTVLNTADYQDELKAQTDALNDALDALDLLADKTQLANAQMAYNIIPVLANKLFNPGYMTESDYAEGHNALIAARTEALEFYDSHDAPTDGIGVNEAISYVNACKSLWDACYKGLVPNGDISVNLSIVDNYAVYKGGMVHDAAGNYGELTLSGGETLGDALTQMLGDNYSPLWYREGRVECYVGVYINGIFVHEPTTLSMNNPPLSLGYTGIRLQDGDRVTLVLTAVPTYYNLSGSLMPYLLREVGGSIKYQRFEQSNAEIVSLTTEVGQEFTLMATAQTALPSSYTGRYFPIEGAAVYVSTCFATEAEALASAAIIDTGVVTRPGGSFIHTLYAEGYYLLTVYDKSANGSLTNGSPILVHVTPSSDPAAVKAAIKTELDAVYNAYGEEYFTAADWTAIEQVYQTGVDGITNAATIGEAAEAQQSAVKAIKAIHDAQTADNTKKLSDFRNVLGRLPDDLSKLASSVEHLITGYTIPDGTHFDGLIGQYAALTDYQKGELTMGEQARYDAVVAVHDNGLPYIDPYDLNLVIEAYTDAAEAALADMTAYLQNHGIDGYAADSENTFNTFSTWLRRPDFCIRQTGDVNDGLTYGDVGSSLVTKADTTDPDRWVTLMFDPGYATYELIDPDGIHGGPNVVSGEGWSIDGSEMTHGDYTGTYYELLHNVTVNINGEPYEIKSVLFEGPDEYDTFYADVITDFEFDDSIGGRRLRVPGAIYRFAMPYNDVTVTVTWGPVAGSPAEQAANELTEAFNAYSRSDYTDQNWALMVASYNNGLAAIAAAGNNPAIETAKSNALAAMAAVEKKETGDTGEIGNSDFDAGEQVGTVDVYVENYTFPGGDFTGKIISEPGYPLGQNDTMMTAVLRALADSGYSWAGIGGSEEADFYDIEYLAKIIKGDKEMGEFSGDPGSGWMGTLNDWFTNYGFQEFSVANGKLEHGDKIRVVFTQNLGVDLGGTWHNSDTTLKGLTVSAATLTPAFVKEAATGVTYEYALVISGSRANVKVIPTASNKNYLVKTYLNDKNRSGAGGNSFYKRTETIPVRLGDTIYIGVGEYAWPSMNNQETEDRDYTGTWYELHVISPDSGASYVTGLITELPAAGKITFYNFVSNRRAIEYARAIYNILNSSEKSKVTNLATLKAAEEKLVFYDEIQNVKDLLASIPKASRITLSHKSAVMNADAEYKALTQEQKLYITVGNVVNYNAAIKRLNELGAFDTGSAPSAIRGSDKEPEGPTNEVTLKPKAEIDNGTAKVKVSAESLEEVVERAKSENIPNLTITPEIDGDVGKVNITLPMSSVSSMANDAGIGMRISTGIADITMPREVLAEIAKKSGSDVSIGIEKVETASLSDENRALVGDRPVYDFSVVVGDKSVSSLGAKVTVSLPYTLQPGEDNEKLTVYYIGENGKAVKIEGTVYDEETGSIIFETDHFSVYAVVYEKYNVVFKDVSDTHWAKEYIYYLAERGFIKGRSETAFAPEDSITRAEFVALLARISGEEMPAAGNKFIDIDKTVWHSKNIEWAVNAGITTGISENTFSPADRITRQDMAVMIFRYAAYKRFSLPADIQAKTFADQTQVRGYARDAVSAMQRAGIISGRENDMFAPLDKATRAEASKMLTVLVQMMFE